MGPFPGLTTGFSIISTFVSGPFSFNFSPNFFGFTGGFFSLSILASISIFLSLTIAFDSIFDFVPLSVNGKIVGANFLLVMPSGVPLTLFSSLGFFGSIKDSHSQDLPQTNLLTFLKFLLLMFLVLILLYPADVPFFKESLIYDMGLD